MSTLKISNMQLFSQAPDWTVKIPEEKYHDDALKGSVITSSMLKEFARCPAAYRDLVTGKTKKNVTTAFRFGRAVHAYILEGEACYRHKFFVGGPVNSRTGNHYNWESKAFMAWLNEFHFDPARVLTPGEHTRILRMAASVRQHGEAARLLSQGWAECSVVGDYAGLPCQARLDWLRADNQVVDLKTTADIASFEADARRFGYLNQFAFYREVAAAAGSGDVSFSAVVVEKKAPYRTGVWNFDAATLAPYAAENARVLARLRRSREENWWPTGFEQTRNFPPAGLPPVWLN